METSRAAELQVLLEGVPLPAGKAQLLAYAVQQRADPLAIEALGSLPDREYASLDEVAEELLHVQPKREEEAPQAPREESGAPPGGDAYTDADPDTGQVRDLDSAEDG